MSAAEFLGLGSRLTNPSNTTLTSNILPLANVGGNGIADNSNCNRGVGIGNVSGVATHVGGGCGTTNLESLNTTNNTNTLVAGYMPLTPSPTQSSISPGTSNSTAFDMFQVKEIKMQHAFAFEQLYKRS